MAFANTVNEYIVSIIFTSNKHLLVEGQSDKTAITKLIMQYKEREGVSASNIVIDTAESIKEEGISYNSAKIREVFERVKDIADKEKLFGFVDREFDGFRWEREIHDELRCHKCDGNLISSRGHSIENYFFDFSVLRECVNTLSAFDHSIALNLLEGYIEDALRVACSITLTTLEIGAKHRLDNIYGRIINTFSENLLLLEDTQVKIDKEIWTPLLRARLNDPQIMQEFLELYSSWLEKTRNEDIQVIQWLCHGHVGMYFLVHIYNACLTKADILINKDQKDLLNPDHNMKFAAIATSWARMAITTNHLDYPQELLDRLF